MRRHTVDTILTSVTIGAICLLVYFTFNGRHTEPLDRGPRYEPQQTFKTAAEKHEYSELARFHVGTGPFGRPKFLVTWQDQRGDWWFRRESDGVVCRFKWPDNYHKGGRHVRRS